MSDSGERDIKITGRKPARSGRVDYGPKEVIHASSRNKVELLPFYVPRTDGSELACKLIVSTRSNPDSPWIANDDLSISFNAKAASELLHSLERLLAVAQHEKRGRFVVVPLEEEQTNIGGNDPAEVARAIARVLAQPNIVRHLTQASLSEELADALRGAIRLSDMRNAVSELRSNLENGIASEAVYQKWCERFPWAFGNAYLVPDDVKSITRSDKVDLLLPQTITGLRDIVELKRPDAKVLLYDDSHRNYFFSQDVSRAIGQCHRYLDLLHSHASHGLIDRPDVTAYHPRALIVIGRSHDWDDDRFRALHGLNTRLSQITVITYDQLLAQGEYLVESVSAS